MKGLLIILVLLALLIGTFLVYRDLSEHTRGPEEGSRVEAIEKAREGAERVQGIQDEIQKRAREASQ